MDVVYTSLRKKVSDIFVHVGLRFGQEERVLQARLHRVDFSLIDMDEKEL